MTSWETAKVFLSKLASREVPNSHKDDEELELSLRFPEHSSWHLLAEDGDAVGIQLRSMYGFRTATANWPRDWKKTLSEVGYAVGQATSALLHDEAELSRRSVHGDDLLLESARPAGTDTALKVFNAGVPPAHWLNRIVCRRRSRRGALRPD